MAEDLLNLLQTRLGEDEELVYDYEIPIKIPTEHGEVTLIFIPVQDAEDMDTGINLKARDSAGKPINLYTSRTKESDSIRKLMGDAGIKLKWDSTIGEARLRIPDSKVFKLDNLTKIFNPRITEEEVDVIYTDAAAGVVANSNKTTSTELKEDLDRIISMDPMFYALLMATRDAFNSNTVKLQEIVDTLKKPLTKERKLKDILMKLPNPSARASIMSNIQNLTKMDFSEFISEKDIQEAKDVGLLESVEVNPSLYSTGVISMDHTYSIDRKKPPMPVVERRGRVKVMR